MSGVGMEGRVHGMGGREITALASYTELLQRIGSRTTASDHRFLGAVWMAHDLCEAQTRWWQPALTELLHRTPASLPAWLE